MSLRPDEQAVRLALHKDAHKALRHIAAEEGRPMAHVARREVERFISERTVSRAEENRGRKK
jgi:hypothetical protein